MDKKTLKELPLNKRINYTVGKWWIKLKMHISLFWSKRILWPFRKMLSVWAFNIAHKTQKWNQNFYDENVKVMYIKVRQKEAFELKSKIIDTRKGGKHVKLLIMETPEREMTITLTEEKFPNLYKTSKKAKQAKK